MGVGVPQSTEVQQFCDVGGALTSSHHDQILWAPSHTGEKVPGPPPRGPAPGSSRTWVLPLRVPRTSGLSTATETASVAASLMSQS